MYDSIFLMLLALVVFGPRRLPQIGRQIGKLMYEFRKASNDFKFQMEEELRMSEDADRRKKEEEERARQMALNPPAATQTVEAQADIGAVEEQASVSAPPALEQTTASPYPGEETYPPSVTEPAATEAASAQPEPKTYPRISPPATGEQVAASRYATNGSAPEPAPVMAPLQEVATESIAAEANIGAEPAPVSDATTQPKGTETVSQHG